MERIDITTKATDINAGGDNIVAIRVGTISRGRPLTVCFLFLPRGKGGSEVSGTELSDRVRGHEEEDPCQ